MEEEEEKVQEPKKEIIKINLKMLMSMLFSVRHGEYGKGRGGS